MHRRSRTIAAVVAAMAAGILLAGCSTTGSTEASVGEPGVAADGMTVEGGAPVMSEEMAKPDAVSAPTVTQRDIIRTGYLSLRAEDVTRSAVEIRALVAAAGGLIASEDSQTSGDSSYATITAQIPAAKLDRFIADVSRLGTVDSLTVTAQDVTSQTVDLDARISALQTSIDRLTELLAEAQRIEDLLAIETQLSQRQSELDALQAQRAYLAEQVALSTMTITVSPLTTITDVDAPGFLSGLQSGWAAFLSLIMVAVTAVGFLLPFAVVLLIIIVPLTIVLVHQSRRRRHAVPAPTPVPVQAPDERGATVPPEAGPGTPT